MRCKREVSLQGASGCAHDARRSVCKKKGEGSGFSWSLPPRPFGPGCRAQPKSTVKPASRNVPINVPVSVTERV